MNNAITIPSLQINGEYVGLVPNSVKVTRGKGTVEVKAQSFGATVQPVFEVNQEEAISHLKYSVYPTPNDLDQIKRFQNLGPTLDVKFTDPNTNETYLIAPAVICNDPDLELGADQTIEVEIKGATLV